MSITVTSSRKSSHSTGNGGNCVAVGHVPGRIAIQDTKDNGAGPVLEVSPADWRRFTASVGV
jgi:hypothetical protein